MRSSALTLGAGLTLAAASLLVLDCYADPEPARPQPTRVFVPEPEQAAERAGEPPLASEPAEPPDKLVLLGPGSALPGLPLDADTLDLLQDRDYAGAAARVAAIDTSGLQEGTAADHAFLLAWLRIRQDQAAQALPLLESLAEVTTAPLPYVALTVAELLLADDRPLEAVEQLNTIEQGSAAIWPRARVQLAEALYALERTAESREVYRGLVQREDPSEGNALALLALARRLGFGSEEAYVPLRRIWREYPHSSEEPEASKQLVQYEARGESFRPSLADKAARADALMAQRRYREAITLLEGMVAGLEASPEACRAWYVYGRSRYRINHLTAAHATLAPAGERCPEHDQDRGAKALYLAGKAMERKKEWGQAAAVYERIPALYPEHSMADDGYDLAGIGWQEAGEQARAMASWEAQVRAYPQGDMAGEGFWRLAWASWLAGETAAAIAWVDSAAETLELASDPVHYRAAHYWRWRWRLYGDREQPSALVQDEQIKTQAVAGLLTLCAEHPASYYALLAAGRLQELAPEQLAALEHPGWGEAPGAWQVRSSFLASSPASNALALARVGLLREALAELDQLDESELIPGEIGVFSDLMVASGQWLWAHDRLRRYLSEHPPETLAHNRARLLTSAYMRRYEAEIKAACEGYPWDYRLFHALVREESNFNKDIVSHAGARGLSQLMPATARSVAGWLGMKISDRGMFEVSKNTRIGARYLHFLVGHYNGDPFLALSGYNAGEGNTDKWLRQRGNRPVDEFVEGIPFRETRHYVKRVSASWQMYHLLYDEGAAFPQLAAFNHQARPDRE